MFADSTSDSENNVQQEQTQDVKNENSVKLSEKKRRDAKRESKPSGCTKVDAEKVIVKSQIKCELCFNFNRVASHC